ncbi:MAG: ATPase component NikO of energizing module of nickel ECF transporter, partial [uncultured Nocardioidaceae bacterium]
ESARCRGAGARLSRRPPGAVRRGPARRQRRAGGAPRPQRGGEDHAGPAPQRHPAAGGGFGDGVGDAGDEAQPAGGTPPRGDRLPGPGRPAVHAHRARRRGVRSAQPRGARRRAGPPRPRGARPGRHGGVRRPPAAPPLVRPAAQGRGGHRARDAAGDPRARRAVVEPRPGLAPRARRHPAQPRRHGPDGDPRPAVRARAVPSLGGPVRRGHGRRRPHPGVADRRGADAGAPPGAAVRIRSPERPGARGRV